MLPGQEWTSLYLYAICSGYIPIGLAVTIFDNGTCAENHVTYVQPYFPVKEPSKIVIGSKLTYGTMSAELMIEWIESMKYIGVDKIITYYMRGLNTDALNVLYNYASKGILDLHFYEPANEGKHLSYIARTPAFADRMHDNIQIFS